MISDLTTAIETREAALIPNAFAKESLAEVGNKAGPKRSTPLSAERLLMGGALPVGRFFNTAIFSDRVLKNFSASFLVKESQKLFTMKHR